MEKVLYTELMTICMMVSMFIMWNDVRKNRGPILISQKIFIAVLIANMSAIFFDLMGVLFSGTNFFFTHGLMRICICLYYFAHSQIGYLWLLYADFELYQDRERFSKQLIPYTIPQAVILLVVLLSFKTEWMYFITESNIYQRGPLFFLTPLANIGYAVYVACMILLWAKENKLNTTAKRELFNRLLLFPIPPCIGTILQFFFPGSGFTFPLTTFVLLVNYIMEQNGQMARDHLTGLYNRGQLEKYLNNQIRHLKKGKIFFLILLDLDKFKTINDTYGHIVGDDALIHAANLLRGSCKRKEDFVARLGGDEFVIIGQCNEEASVEKIVNRMQEVAEEFNRTSEKPYKLSFSIGYTVFHGEGVATLDMLINEADQKMYINKREKKSRENIVVTS